MLLFGLALIVMMLCRPAGLWPSHAAPPRICTPTTSVLHQEQETVYEPPSDHLLELASVGKHFGGLHALADVALHIRKARSTA